MPRQKPRMFTETELRDMNRLRSELADILTPDLNTDFNIYRWIHGWQGDLAEASRRFRAYIENRKVAHLDDPHLLEHFTSHPIIKKCAQFYSFNIFPLGINPMDNTVLLLQRFEGVDYHKMTKVMTCGQFLSLYFVTCEWNLRQVLTREAESGRKSGLTIIFDLDQFPVMQYANPQSAIYKIFMLCLGLLQDYFCEMLHQLLIINAPTMLNVVLAIAKKFLRPATQKKFIIVSNKADLFHYVDPAILPVRYGGQRRLSSDTFISGGTTWHLDPESFVLVPRAITDADLFVPRVFKHKMMADQTDKTKHSLIIRRHVTKSGSRMFWQFNANSEVQFTVVHLLPGDQKVRLCPCWTVITPKLPETGCVICSEAGDYALEFHDPHAGKHQDKIEYVIDIEPPE